MTLCVACLNNYCCKLVLLLKYSLIELEKIDESIIFGI